MNLNHQIYTCIISPNKLSKNFVGFFTHCKRYCSKLVTSNGGAFIQSLFVMSTGFFSNNLTNRLQSVENWIVLNETNTDVCMYT